MTGAPIKITLRETELIRHAIGLTDGRNRSYRNYFTVAQGGTDFPHWKALCDRKLATGRHASRHQKGLVCFQVTRAAAEAVLEPGESLDPEDFPV